jgi:acyl carrier protein
VNTLFSLQSIFREVFDDESLTITPQTSTNDISGWDSVAQVKIVLTVEEQFGIQFSENEVSTLKTVGGFIDALEKRKHLS